MAERRKHHRVNVKLKGRFMMPDGTEHQAETTDVSLTGLRFRSLSAPFRGQKIVAYVTDLGRIEGVATRIMKDGFAMSITTSHRRRDKIAGALTWAQLEALEQRGRQRIIPRERSATLNVGNSGVHEVEILDVSTGGAAIRSHAFLPLGTQVRLGTHAGLILRVENGAYAIAFERELPAEAITPEIRFT